MNRSFPDLSNTLEWNLVSRRTLTASRVGTRWIIPPPAFPIENSFIVCVGVSCPNARPNWQLGCYATMNLLLRPSSTSQFPGSTRVQSVFCRLNQLTLCVFPKLSADWYLSLDFPWWHDSADVEVWRHDGRDLDAVTELAEVQTTVEEIRQRLENL